MSNVLVLNPTFCPRSHRLSLRVKLRLKLFLISNIILICFLLFFYVFQINEMLKNSYLIKNYQKQLEEVSKGNNELKILLPKLTSLENIEKIAENLNLENNSQVKYIKILENQVVTK